MEDNLRSKIISDVLVHPLSMIPGSLGVTFLIGWLTFDWPTLMWGVVGTGFAAAMAASRFILFGKKIAEDAVKQIERNKKQQRREGLKKVIRSAKSRNLQDVSDVLSVIKDYLVKFEDKATDNLIHQEILEGVYKLIDGVIGRAAVANELGSEWKKVSKQKNKKTKKELEKQFHDMLDELGESETCLSKSYRTFCTMLTPAEIEKQSDLDSTRTELAQLMRAGELAAQRQNSHKTYSERDFQ